jgi:tetratricopeptide (TPR) repeat protein
VRKLPIAVLVLLAVGPAARAGVYNLSDPATLFAVYTEGEDVSTPEGRANVITRVEAAARLDGLPMPPQVPARLFELRAAAIEPKGNLDPNSPRALYLRQVDYFERMRANGTLGTSDAVALSGAYLRLGDVTAARRVLNGADQGHFLVQAHLAAVWQQLRDYDSAVTHEERALRLWPKAQAGWSTQMLEFYRDGEQYNLKLLKLRKDKPDENPAVATLDPLFPGLRFVNDQGRYAAGELARKEADKLPKNAGNLVLQLTLWQPRDRRLCWLLAEMLNAHGQVIPAARLLTSMVETDKLEWPELRQHQLVLEKAAGVMRQLDSSAQSRFMLSSQMMLIPQGRLGAPIAGDLAYAACTLSAPAVWAPYLENKQEIRQEEPQQGGTLSPTGPLPFNVQHVVISFVFGVLVAALLAMQWQALRRRRQPATGPPPQQDTHAGVEAGVGQAEGEVAQQAPPS